MKFEVENSNYNMQKTKTQSLICMKNAAMPLN